MLFARNEEITNPLEHYIFWINHVCAGVVNPLYAYYRYVLVSS